MTKHVGDNYRVELTSDGGPRTTQWGTLRAALRYASAVYSPEFHTRVRLVTVDGVVILDTERQDVTAEEAT